MGRYVVSMLIWFGYVVLFWSLEVEGWWGRGEEVRESVCVSYMLWGKRGGERKRGVSERVCLCELCEMLHYFCYQLSVQCCF